jgi:hypothetical protein
MKMDNKIKSEVRNSMIAAGFRNVREEEGKLIGKAPETFCAEFFLDMQKISQKTGIAMDNLFTAE